LAYSFFERPLSISSEATTTSVFQCRLRHCQVSHHTEAAAIHSDCLASAEAARRGWQVPALATSRRRWQSPSHWSRAPEPPTHPHSRPPRWAPIARPRLALGPWHGRCSDVRMRPSRGTRCSASV
jgi:hypothetical protein